MTDNTEIKRLGAYLFTLQRVVAALIATHPDPARLVAALETVAAHSEIEHLYDGAVSDAVMGQAKDFLGELLEIARDTARDHRKAG